MGVIYKITNLKNNKIYIGSTVKFEDRKSCHINQLKENKHHSAKLQASWNKYGEENFIFETIEEIENHLLIQKEQFWLDDLKPQLNISPTAGSPFGVKHSLQARENMSNAHKKLTKEQRNHKKDCRCSFCHNFKETHPRWIEREIRQCICGCKKEYECRIDSNRRFISGHNKAKLGKKQPLKAIESQKEKVSKPIEQYDLNGNFIRDWKSIKEAAVFYKTSADRISQCCYNKRKNYIKFMWKFKIVTI